MGANRLSDWENAPQNKSVIGVKKKMGPEPLKVFVRWNCGERGKFESVETECFYCQEPLHEQNRTKDHLRAKSKGYKLIKNKVFACLICNTYKGAMTLREWREYLLKMNSHNTSGNEKCIYILNRRKKIIEKLDLVISKIRNA